MKAIKRDRKVVMATRLRDGDICQCCGCGDGSEVHHIHPLCFGGEDTANNAICLCAPCHKYAPNDPDKFLSYQRDGGAFSRFINDMVVTARTDLLKEWAVKSAAQYFKLVAEGKQPLNEIRLSHWGWTTGRNGPIGLYLDEQIDAGEAAAMLRSRIAQAAKHLRWRLALQGTSEKPTLPNEALKCISLAIKESSEASMFKEAQKLLNDYLIQIYRMLSLVKDQPLPPYALEPEYDCAVEDLMEICGEEMMRLEPPVVYSSEEGGQLALAL